MPCPNGMIAQPEKKPCSRCKGKGAIPLRIQDIHLQVQMKPCPDCTGESEDGDE